LLQNRLLGRLHFCERRVDGNHKVFSDRENVRLVRMAQGIYRPHHLTTGLLPLRVLEKLDSARGAAGNGHRHAAALRGRARGALDRLRGAHRRDRAKRHALAARHDGGQNHLCACSQQNKRHARRRLLKRFEQRVGRVGAQLFGTVDDVDLAAGADGRQGNVLQQLARLVDQVAGRGFGRQQVNVRVRMARHANARVAAAARSARQCGRRVAVLPRPLAQQGLGKGPSGIELSRTGGAQKEVGMARPARCHRTGDEIAYAGLGVEAREQRVIGGRGHARSASPALSKAAESPRLSRA